MRPPMPAHPTPDELDAAWRELHEPGWPTLAELQRGVLRYQQVRACALRRRTQPAQPACTAQAPMPWPPRRASPPPPPPVHGLDAKRLAAGERPDDDDAPTA